MADLADVGLYEGIWVANYGTSAKFNGKLDKVKVVTFAEKK